MLINIFGSFSFVYERMDVDVEIMSERRTGGYSSDNTDVNSFYYVSISNILFIIRLFI